MHSQNLFSGHKRKSNDEDKQPRKKRRLPELFILSDINYYKKIMGNWVYLWPTLTPNHILINLLLYKKKEAINSPLTIFQDRPSESTLHFEENLLTQLGYSEEKYLPDRNGIITIYINNQEDAKEWKLIPLLNALLETSKINPKDKLFSLLIAFLNFYTDFFRLHLAYNLDLDSFPHFKKQLFIPSAIYQRTQHNNREKSMMSESDELVVRVNNYLENNLELLTLVKLSDQRKERLIKQLLATALCKDSINEDPDIKFKRRKACIAIKKIERLSPIDTYLKIIVLPLHSFDRDQFVRKVGCELLGDIYPFVSANKTEMIFQKILDSLSHYSRGKEEVFGACRALMKMTLSPVQTDKAYTVLVSLLKEHDALVIKQAIWSLDLSDEQFKIVLGSRRKKMFWFLGEYFFNFLRRKQKTPEFCSYLIEWCLANYHSNYFFPKVLSIIPIPDSKQTQVFEFLNKALSISPDIIIRPDFYKALLATKQADSLLAKGLIRLLNMGIHFENLNIERILKMNILCHVHLSSDNLSLLKTALVTRFNAALERHSFNNLLHIFQLKEQLNCHLLEIDQTKVIEHFSPVKLASLILENLNIQVEIRHIIFFHEWIYAFKQLPQKKAFDFVGEVNKSFDDNKEISDILKLLQDEKSSHAATRPLLMQLKNVLINFLFKILDHERFHDNRSSVYDIVFSLLRQIHSPSILYDLEKLIFKNEMKSKNVTDKFDCHGLAKINNDILILLKEILNDFMMENNPYIHLNFLTYLEKENESSLPSIHRLHLIQMIREESTKLVLLNLIGRQNNLPSEVTQYIVSYVYR